MGLVGKVMSACGRAETRDASIVDLSSIYKLIQ